MPARRTVDDTPPLTRADVEALILVELVGEKGCDLATLTQRLELAPLRAHAVRQAVMLVADRGWLWLEEDKVTTTHEGIAAAHQALDRCL